MKANYSHVMKARYEPDPSGCDPANPLLEALPTYTRDEIMEELSDSSKFFHPEWRQQRPEYRIEKFVAIRENFFVPRPRHADLAISFRQLLRARYEAMPWSDPAFFSPDYLGGGDHEYAVNLGVFGCPGSGKSMAVKKVAGLYPRVIKHSIYRNRRLRMSQAPCLRVICTHLGGAKSLYVEILQRFAERMGTHYSAPKTTADGENKIKQIAKTGGIGIIMIDEIKNAFRKGEHNEKLQDKFEEDMLTAFTRLNEHAA